MTLLQDQPRLLPELSGTAGGRRHRSLAARGVDVRTGARARASARGPWRSRAAKRCTPRRRSAPSARGPTRWSSGWRFRSSAAASSSMPTSRCATRLDCGRSATARWCECARRKLAPPTAQFAVREARHLAANLLAVLQGAPTRAFDYRARGSMAAIGHQKGVADIFGIPLSGLPAWLLWRAYYLSQMPTLGRKVRIFVEWTWGMFFPTDITHLRFTRSHEVDEAAETQSTVGPHRRRGPRN